MAANRWLLPDGITELLPRDAVRVERLRRRILDLYFAWGYEPVEPPLVEYLESLLTGMGRELDVPLPTTAVTNEMLTAARGMGLAAKDFAAVFEVLAHMAGVTP